MFFSDTCQQFYT